MRRVVAAVRRSATAPRVPAGIWSEEATVGRLTGAAKAGVSAARGWRRANREEDEFQAAGGRVEDRRPAPFDVRLAPEEAVVLCRYVAGRAVLGQVEPFGVGKYAFLALALLFHFLLDVPVGFTILWVSIFVACALAQWWLTHLVRRFGLMDELSGFDDASDQIKAVWWPNLQRELRRVGISPRPVMLLRLGVSTAARRGNDEKRKALGEVDWLAVMPLEEWRDARRQLAIAAGRTPPPDPEPAAG
jgi:hypothetical protein